MKAGKKVKKADPFPMKGKAMPMAGMKKPKPMKKRGRGQEAVIATKTLGTAATTSLVAVQWTQALADADIASIKNAILDDVYGSSRIFPDAFSRQGKLFVPNRGVLSLRVGDWIAYDPATGFPILLSSGAAAGAQWVHS